MEIPALDQELEDSVRIGFEQPGCVAWEPAFAQDLGWCFLQAMSQVGVPGGTSAYFRLSTHPMLGQVVARSNEATERCWRP